jgi:ADP-heptose:LPS heptosyltransferase
MPMIESPIIIISRCDSIGDVVLTLPMAGVIKKHLPKSKVYFLAKTYTWDVVALSEHVDGFINYDDLRVLSIEQQIEMIKGFRADIFLHVFPKKEIALLAEKANVPLRVGTLSRLYHWYTCNRKIHLPRKHSKLHEAELNLKILGVLGIHQLPPLEDIRLYYGFTRIPALPEKFKRLIDPERINVILHPKSKGSAREWGLDNFQALIQLLPKHKFKLFVSGSKEEGEALTYWIDKNPELTDITGKMNLSEFIAFISVCDALVAASTGPLHIASALGKTVVGLFAPMRPIHPGRWKPLGTNAKFLVINKNCEDCRTDQNCACIRAIHAQQVVDLLPVK